MDQRNDRYDIAMDILHEAGERIDVNDIAAAHTP